MQPYPPARICLCTVVSSQFYFVTVTDLERFRNFYGLTVAFRINEQVKILCVVRNLLWNKRVCLIKQSNKRLAVTKTIWDDWWKKHDKFDRRIIITQLCKFDGDYAIVLGHHVEGVTHLLIITYWGCTKSFYMSE